MTEIGAEVARAPKLAGATRRERPWAESAPGRWSTYLVLAAVCAATAAISLIAMAELGFSHVGVACALVALAGALACGYFIWRELRGRDATSRALPDGLRAPDIERVLEGLDVQTLAAHRRDLAGERQGAPLALDAQSVAMREHLQAAVDSASILLAAHTRMISDRLGEEQKRVTEALEIYGESIVSRLNLASVSVAREFRDGGEALNKRIETASVAAVASIARQAESAAVSLAKSAAESEARLAEAGRGIIARIEVVGARSGDKAVALTEAAADRWERVVVDLSEAADRNLGDHLETIARRRQALGEALEGDGQALAERASQAAAQVETRLNDAGASIDRFVDSALARIEARLDSRAEALAARLADLDHELELRWSTRSRGLVAELTGAAAQAEAAAAAASAEVARVAGTAAEAAQLAFERSAQDIAHRWSVSADAAAHDIQSAAERSTQTLSAHGETLSARLSAFEASLAERGEGVVERIDAQTLALRDALDEARTTVAAHGGGVVAAIHSAAQGLDGALADRSALLQQTFDAHRATLAERAEADAQSLRQLAQAHGAAVTGALDDHRLALTASLADTLADARRLAEERGHESAQGATRIAQGMVEGLIGEMRTLSEALGTRGAALRDQIVARQGEMIDVIEGGVARTERRFAESLRATAEAVDGCGRTVSQILAQAAQGLKGALTENAREAAGLIDASGQALAQTVERSSRGSVAALAASVEAQRAALEASVAQATGEVEGARARLADSLDAAATDAEARLVTRGAETVAALRAGVEAATRTLGEERARFAAATLEATRRAQSAFLEGGEQGRRALDEETGRSLARLEAGRAAMAGAAGEALARFETDFARHLAELGASLQGANAQLSQEIAAPLKANVERIQAEGQELSSATRALAETILSTSATHRERLHQAFADETDAMARILDANAATFRSGLETVVAGADEVFLSRGLDVARAIAARVDELRTLLDGDALTLLKALEARSHDLSEQIDAVSQRSLGDFERKASQLIGTLTRRGDDLLSAMAAASSESARKVGHLTGEVDAHTGRAAGTLRDIERKVGAMLAAVDRRSAELAVDPRARGHDGEPSAKPVALVAEASGPKAGSS